MRSRRARASASFIESVGAGNSEEWSLFVRHDGKRRRGGMQSTGEIAGCVRTRGYEGCDTPGEWREAPWRRACRTGGEMQREEGAEAGNSESWRREEKRGVGSVASESLRSSRCFPQAAHAFPSARVRSAVKSRKVSSRHETDQFFVCAGRIEAWCVVGLFQVAARVLSEARARHAVSLLGDPRV